MLKVILIIVILALLYYQFIHGRISIVKKEIENEDSTPENLTICTDDLDLDSIDEVKDKLMKEVEIMMNGSSSFKDKITAAIRIGYLSARIKLLKKNNDKEGEELEK